jgi:uncharacterized membrane protein
LRAYRLSITGLLLMVLFVLVQALNGILLPSCKVGNVFSCAHIGTSSDATPLGVPPGYLGAFWAAGIALLVPKYLKVAQAVALSGCLFVAYLRVQEIRNYSRICMYCLGLSCMALAYSYAIIANGDQTLRIARFWALATVTTMGALLGGFVNSQRHYDPVEQVLVPLGWSDSRASARWSADKEFLRASHATILFYSASCFTCVSFARNLPQTSVPSDSPHLLLDVDTMPAPWFKLISETDELPLLIDAASFSKDHAYTSTSSTVRRSN